MWALHQTAVLVEECTKAYDAYEFHRVYQLCNQFCSVTLSATYHDIIKDRLYTLGVNHPLRRSSQTAIAAIFDALVKILAPFLTFTADEAWSYAETGQEYSAESIHLQDWPRALPGWMNPELATRMASRLKYRALVNEAIEPLRAAGKLGKSLDAIVTFRGAHADHELHAVGQERSALAELFIVSDVKFDPIAGAAPENSILIEPCAELGHTRCPRCWRWVPKLVHNAHGEVCPRCAEALSS